VLGHRRRFRFFEDLGVAENDDGGVARVIENRPREDARQEFAKHGRLPQTPCGPTADGRGDEHDRQPLEHQRVGVPVTLAGIHPNILASPRRRFN